MLYAPFPNIIAAISIVTRYMQDIISFKLSEFDFFATLLYIFSKLFLILVQLSNEISINSFIEGK